MGFVQLGFLGALGALSIPIIIHLTFRQRSRPVDLGTIQFLSIVLRSNARRRRLKHWVLLGLRLACVALAAFLFARPYLLANEADARDRLEVVLIDRSASMGLHPAGGGGAARPIDRAVAEARRIVSRAGAKTERAVALLAATVQPLKGADPLTGVIEPPAAGTNYAAAMAWARDLCVRSRRPVRVVHVLTDLQRSGLDRGDPVTMPPEVDVHLIDLGRAFPRNVAVTTVATSPTTIRPGESATITAGVVNTAPVSVHDLTVRLRLECAGVVHDREKKVELDGGATVEVAFDPAPLAEGLWRGHVEIAPGDELAFDDRRYLAVSVAPPIRVLLVAGDSGGGRTPFSSETHYLQAALRLALAGERYARSPFEVRAFALGDEGGALPDLDGVDVVVLANVARLGSSDPARLAELVTRGGGLVVFTGDRVDAAAASPLGAVGLGVGRVEGPVTDRETAWRLERWDASHPILLPFADPEHGDLRRPSFTGITRIVPDDDAHVLAWFGGEAPALLEKRHGRGRVLWFASACDRDWGDWPRGRLFLPMVHQMLAEAAGLAEGGRVRQRIADDATMPGTRVDEGICWVVNADPFESETARCTAREFADRFGFLPAKSDSVAEARKRSRAPADDRLRDDEIWPWLAFGLMGVLLLENFLANRTAA
jgi:hypothetical protein